MRRFSKEYRNRRFTDAVVAMAVGNLQGVKRLGLNTEDAMLEENGLSFVTVKKDDLLKAIKPNRDKHINDFNAAIREYRSAVVSFLEKELKAARQAEREEGTYAVDYSENPQPPSSHQNEYDRAICMIEMSVSDEIRISQSEFSKFVLDEWAWKEAFTAQVMNYSVAGVKKRSR